MRTRKEYVIDLLIKVKTTSADWKKEGQKKGETVLPIFVDFRSNFEWPVVSYMILVHITFNRYPKKLFQSNISHMKSHFWVL